MVFCQKVKEQNKSPRTYNTRPIARSSRVVRSEGWWRVRPAEWLQLQVARAELPEQVEAGPRTAALRASGTGAGRMWPAKS